MAGTENLYDAVVIGGGPAGLTAALYLARARCRVIVLEKEQLGGQITITAEVVNYPGVERVSGKALTEIMRRQAASFGAEFLTAEAKRIEAAGELRKVYTDRGTLECFGVLLATGARPRSGGFSGEQKFRGHGVAYCATCDGEFFAGKEIFVIGGGFAAAEESVFLTKYAAHVTILIRGTDFSCAKSAADAARNHEKISVLTNVTVQSVEGGEMPQCITWKNSKTGEVTRHCAPKGESFGVFVFAGYEPATELAHGIAQLDPQGYLVTDPHKRTSAEGIYGAGDVCQKPLRQVVTAVGDGALAADGLEHYCAKMQEKTGLRPQKRKPDETRLRLQSHKPDKAELPLRNDKPDETELRLQNHKPDEPVPRLRNHKSDEAEVRFQNNTAGETGKIAVPDTPPGSGLFSADIIVQLQDVFARMQRPLLLRVYPDERPASAELLAYMEELSSLTDKLSVSLEKLPEKDAGAAGGNAVPEKAADAAGGNAVPEKAADIGGRNIPFGKIPGSEQEVSAPSGFGAESPFVSVCFEDGTPAGLFFHGVPGGHEFTSFLLGLYNASGPGQPLEEEIRARIQAIKRPVRMEIMVTLSCALCPELVIAAQRIAAENPRVSAEIYDIGLFPERRERYHIMSVPCLILNGGAPKFGKMNIRELLDLIGKD